MTRALVIGGPHDGAHVEVSEIRNSIQLEVAKDPDTIACIGRIRKQEDIVMERHEYIRMDLGGPSKSDPHGSTYLMYRHSSLPDYDVMQRLIDGYRS